MIDMGMSRFSQKQVDDSDFVICEWLQRIQTGKWKCEAKNKHGIRKNWVAVSWITNNSQVSLSCMQGVTYL